VIRENQKFLNQLQLILDIIILIISLTLAYYIRFWGYTEDYLTFNYYLKAAFLLIPLYLFLYYTFELYEPHRKKGLSEEAFNIIKSNFLGMIILLSVLFIIRQIDYSRFVFVLFVIFNIVLTISERLAIRIFLRHIRRKGYNIKYILIIGAGDLGQQFAKKVQANKHLGYSIVGYLDDKKSKGRKIKEVPVIGRLSDLEKIIEEHLLDEVIIALPLKEYDNLKDIINICEKSGVKTQIIPDYLRYIPARPTVDEIDGIPLINIRRVPLDNLANRFIKRTMDIVLSLIGIIITSPIMIIVAILIKLESPGPVVFKQERVGLNRRNFMMYKFRSMRVQNKEESDTQWTTKDDPRKTKIGEFIRKTSIDELLQLFNVLKGDMSLVGPRPERPFFVEQFRETIPKYMVKHQVRPGITGWAQVNGWRGDTSIEERIKCDLYYIENWSLALDIKIIILTVINGFVHKNAY